MIISGKSRITSWLWPDNVTVFKKEEAEAVDFPEYNTTVYGLSYWHREIRDRRYDDLRPVNRSRCNILLAHGGDERHIPFSAERILQNGFDYIAAGHIHRSGWLMPHKAVMAGSLEPTDCNDTGRTDTGWERSVQRGRCVFLSAAPLRILS